MKDIIHSQAPSVLLDRQKAAEFLGVTPSTLAHWASTQRYDLKYVKVGRLVKYRLNDLEIFLSKREVNYEAK
ncbi:MAG: DNA-binding protein [Alphaproteobacteria bacterium]|nr:DNA-binding protein [Alphaproteobacteria bacterium]